MKSTPPINAIRTALLAATLTGSLPVHAIDFTTFITSNVPAISGDQQGEADDPDKDGVPSVIEFLVDGMNPGVPDAQLLPAPVVVGNQFEYEVTKRVDAEVNADIEIYNTGPLTWEVASSGITEDASSLKLTVSMSSGDIMLARVRASASGGSTNNPIALAYPTEYGSGDYAWTDVFAWDTEFDVTSYGAVADGSFANSTGTDNTAAFNAAMAAAATAGGGVVRVPAGVYYIGDHLLIPPGVVIRGEAPTGDAKSMTLNPPSKLVFPKVAPTVTGTGSAVSGGPGVGYKRIYSDAVTQIDASDTDPVDVAAHSTIGLVNLDINRAAIVFAPPVRNPIKDGGNWSGVAESLILAPFVSGTVGQNFIIYGVRNNNTAIADGADGVNSGIPNSSQHDWQRNPWRFNANIRIMSGGNAIVANCQLNDLSSQNSWAWGFPGDPAPTFMDDSYEQPGYLAQNNSGATYYALNGHGMATFRHSNQYTLSINGLYYFAKAGSAGATPDAYGNENGWYGSPTSAPWLFQSGHVIRDNFLYGNLGGRIEASGNGLVIDNNCVRDALGKGAFLQASGVRAPRQGTAYLSRGLLLAGSMVTTTNNDVITTKHKVGAPSTQAMTQYYSNDGESIMFDNTTTPVRGWNVSYNKVNANIFAYKCKGIEDMDLIGNDFYDQSLYPKSSDGNPFWIDANPNSSSGFSLTNVRIEDNTNIPNGRVSQLGSGSGTGNTFKNNSAFTPGVTIHQYTTGDLGAGDISGNTDIPSSPL